MSRTLAIALYASGALVALLILFLAARGGGTVATLSPGAVPVFLLEAGEYRLDPPEVEGIAVFRLTDRAPLALEGGVFRVEETAAIVVAYPETATVPLVLERTGTVRVSASLFVALALAPLATVPGLLALEATRPRIPLAAAVEDSSVGLVRRLAGGAIDALVIAAMMVVLLALAPVLHAFVGLYPLAPLAYLWSVSARGKSIGQWFLLVRVINEEGAPPGATAGFLRVLAAVAGWVCVGAGLAVAALDGERRAFHDRFSGTLVIRD